MARPTPVRLAAIAATTSALVVLGLLAPVPAASAKNGHMYGAPKAGHCYNLPGKAAYNRTFTKARPIKCKHKHRLWIVKVKKLPRKIHYGSKRFRKYEHNICAIAYRKKIGKLDKRFGLSSYARFSFIPKKKQRKHGAHWFSCELGVRAGGKHGKALKPNRHKLPPKLSKHPAKWMRLCAKNNSVLTSCSNKHRFRASWAHGYKAHGHPKAKAKKMCRKRLGRKRTWVYAWTSVHGRSPWIATCLT